MGKGKRMTISEETKPIIMFVVLLVLIVIVFSLLNKEYLPVVTFRIY